MSPILRAEWRQLLMLNLAVDPAILAPRVPAGTELDTWRGEAFVSLVGFIFLRTKLLGIPLPFHQRFEEVNLRFYVQRDAPDGVRRGVVFIKEIVSKPMLAAGARWLYGEPYAIHAMQHDFAGAPDDMQGVEYRWKVAGHWNRIGARVTGPPAPMAPASDEEFIAEHYWGYTRLSPTRTREYRVEHPRWRILPIASPEMEIDAESLYGPELGAALRQPPASALLAEGSEVSVHMHAPLRI